MSDKQQTGGRGKEAEFWQAAARRAWVPLQARIDAMLMPLTRVLLAEADPRPGERVLDIGCGTGATVLELAERVGPDGYVLGLDVAEPMLERARERAAGRRQVELRLGDAATAPWPEEGFDLAFSRFGVMFFADPVAAFAHIRGALRPGGRLVFAAFRGLAENPWVAVPGAAARRLLPDMPAPGPEEPGQFAFADPIRVRRILETAGFHQLVFAPHDTTMQLAGPGPEVVAEAARFAAQLGPAGRALAEAPEEKRAEVREAIAGALGPLAGPEGIALGGAIWIVSARA